MSLQARLEALVAAVGADIKLLRTQVAGATGTITVIDGGATPTDAYNAAVIGDIEPYVMSVTGILTVQTGKSRIYFESGYTIDSVRASVNTAPTGAAVIVDVSVNGTSIYTTAANKPTIPAGSYTGFGGTPSSNAVAAGQYITVDVDQVGSTVAGSDLTVVIRMRRSS